MVTTFKLPRKNRRKIQAVSVAAGFVLAAVCAPLAPAASLEWDTNGAGTNGFGNPATGTWDNNLTANWITSGNYGTGTSAKWNNAVENTAVFITRNDSPYISTPGTVSLNSTIVADGITLTVKSGTGALWTFNANAPADTLSAFTAGGTFALNAASSTSSALITAIIADHGGSGLSMAGAGKFILAANNTYTGATAIGGGILSLAGTNGTSAGTLNTTGGVTVNFATFNLDDSASGANGVLSRFGAVTLNGTLSVTGNTSNNTADSSNGALTLNGTTNFITITPGANEASSLTFTALTHTAGSLVFTGTNVGAFTGGVTQSHLLFNTAPTLVGNPILGGPDAGVLGYVTVTDTATTSSLATYDSTNGIRALIDGVETTTGNTVTANQNVLINATGASTPGNINVQSLTLRNSGSAYTFNLGGTLTNSSNAFLSSSTTTGANALTTIAGGTIALGSNPAYFHTAGPLTISSAITGTGGLIKDGAGTLTLSGTLPTGAIGDVVVGVGTLASSALNVTSLTLGGGATLSLTGALTNSTNSFTSTGTAAASISGSTVALGTTAGNFHTVGSLTISSAISGTAGFIKDGVGTLTVSGSNTGLAGDVTIANGTLTLGSALTVTSLTLGSGTSSGSVGTASPTLTITSGNITVLGSGASNTITPNATNLGVGGTGTAGLITLSGGTLALPNKIVGDSGLSIGGTGSVSFTANTATLDSLKGTLTIGTLSLPGPSVSLVLNTYDGGDVVINSGTLNLSNNRPGLSLKSGANLTMHGGIVNNFDGLDQTYNNLNSDSSTASISSSAAANTLTITNSGTFAGVISDDGSHATSLSKTTGGTLILSGNNTYFGATTITGGTITAAAAGTLGTNGPLGKGNVAVSGGTLNSSVTNVNISGNLSLTTGTLDPNTQSTVGSFTLNTNKTFTMSGGTLAVNIASTSSFDQIIDKTGSTTGAFTITGGTLDLGLGGANSGLYTSTYQLLQGFAGANSVSGLTITNYDTTDWTASLAPTGILSFAANPVPEPASLALLGLGALGLVTRRRRTR